MKKSFLSFAFVTAMVLSLGIFAMYGCDNVSSDSEVTATEKWAMTIDTSGSGDWTFDKMSDGSITAFGDWTNDYNGMSATCSYSAADVTISGAAISFTATGTAQGSSTTSGFSVTVQGTIDGDSMTNGTYTITFDNSDWPSPISGTLSATLTKGSGVTSESDVAR